MTHRLCTFFVAGRRLGLEVECVRELRPHTPSTRVPLAPPAVVGLHNLRGQVVAAIDLAAHLGLQRATPLDRAPGIVVEVGGGIVNLLVDRVGDVVTVGEDAIEPPPAKVSGAMREAIVGACRMPEGMLLVLDPERALPADDEQ